MLKTDDDCYIRYPALAATLQQPQLGKGARKESAGPQMSGVYKGCLENPHGFFALRNEDSKWHIPYEDMPDWVVSTPAMPAWLQAMTGCKGRFCTSDLSRRTPPSHCRYRGCCCFPIDKKR